ncbi:MAG: polysaccharide deacetylase family protein [Acidobacteria bacterium]|nr:MAG: polysaccharide deacetylase family protein [Acidobacteriota bacterium]
MISKVGIGSALAGAGYLAYHCYSPESQLYGRTLTHCANPKHLALTYDDGPNDLYTERLLEVLARHEVKATFFLIGRFVSARPQIARSIADGGHLLANHTETHPNLLFLSHSKLRHQLSNCAQAIADATGIQTRYFRPPFGARRPAVLEVARELELEPVMWSVTCYDWHRRASAESVFNHARKGIERSRIGGPVVLLHDGSHTTLGQDRSHTVEATDRLIKRFKNDYCFRRIDEI